MNHNRRYNPDKHGIWCRYCHAGLGAVTATIDHIIPLSKGGLDTWSNLRWCCLRCNGLKSDLSVEQFRELLSRRTGVVMFAFEYSPLVHDDGPTYGVNEDPHLKTAIGEILAAAMSK